MISPLNTDGRRDPGALLEMCLTEEDCCDAESKFQPTDELASNTNGADCICLKFDDPGCSHYGYDTHRQVHGSWYLYL